MKHFLYFRLHEAGPGPEHLLGPLQRQEAGLAAGVRGPGPHAPLPRPDHGDTWHVAAGTRVLGWRAAGLLKLSGLCWLLLPWPLDRCAAPGATNKDGNINVRMVQTQRHGDTP